MICVRIINKKSTIYTKNFAVRCDKGHLEPNKTNCVFYIYIYQELTASQTMEPIYEALKDTTSELGASKSKIHQISEELVKVHRSASSTLELVQSASDNYRFVVSGHWAFCGGV